MIRVDDFDAYRLGHRGDPNEGDPEDGTMRGPITETRAQIVDAAGNVLFSRDLDVTLISGDTLQLTFTLHIT